VTSFDCQYFPDLATWFAGVQQQWAETHATDEGSEGDEEAAPAEGEAASAPAADGPPPAAAGPTGPGWVVQLTGYHYHNEDHHKPDEAAQFVRSTIVKGLLGEGDDVAVSAGPMAGETVPVKELGIGYPVIVAASPVRTIRVPKEGAAAPGDPQAPRPDLFPGAAQPEDLELALKRFDFTLQFCWQPVSPGSPKPAAPAPAPPPEGN
jgi:type IV pilus assembly protein PilM